MGRIKAADDPIPSIYPADPDPARVLTIPPGVILRIAKFPVSATYIVLSEATAIPVGFKNLEFNNVVLRNPPVEDPAYTPNVPFIELLLNVSVDDRIWFVPEFVTYSVFVVG